MAAFCAMSFYALFLAYGYQYDVSRQNIKKTSIIDLAVREEGVELMLNGKMTYRGNLPYQIKGVLPGTAELLLKKKDFLPWKRILNVKADFVSKITDILFVPENILEWIKELISFAGDVSVVAGDEFFVVIKPNQSYITVIFLNDDGTFRQKEIALHYENLQSVEVLSSRRLMAHFSGGAMELIAMDEEKYAVFRLPELASSLQIRQSDDVIYYIFNNDLYRFAFTQFNNEEVMPVFGEKIRSDISSFALTKKKIYYLSSGMLFVSNFDGKQIVLLDQSFQNFYSIKAIEGENSSFLVLQTTPVDANDLAFSLYFLNPDSTTKFVGERIVTSPFFNSLGQILFSDSDKQLFLYDPRLDEKILLHRYDGDFGLIAWFDDEHFLFRGTDSIFVSDISISNVFPLLTNIDRFEDMFFFAKNRTLFYLRKSKLNVLNLRNK